MSSGFRRDYRNVKGRLLMVMEDLLVYLVRRGIAQAACLS